MVRNNRIIICVLLCILLVQFVPVSPVAAAQPDLDQPCEMRISYFYIDEPLTGASFNVYRIGKVNTDGTWSLTGSAADFPLDTSHMSLGVSDFSEWAYSYLLLEDRQPDSVLTIDDKGSAKKELPAGLYLVAGQKFETSQGIFTAEPILAALPYRYTEDEPWHNDLQIKPKCRFTPKGDFGTVNRSVMKVWEDEDASKRPQEIEVNLLRDGEVVDTVILSEANRWTHQWNDLSQAYQWRVVETPVKGYHVEVDLVLGIYLIHNKQTEEKPTEPSEPSEPEESTEPSNPSDPSEPSNSSEPSEPSGTTEPTSSSEPSATTVQSESTQPSETDATTAPTGTEPSKLPQTGQLWWPVPILFAVGFLMIVAGIRLYRGEKHGA